MVGQQLVDGGEIVYVVPREHWDIYRKYNRVGKLIRLGAQCECCLKVGINIVIIRRPNAQYNTFTIVTEEGMELTIDHIKPKAKGGKNGMKNYQVLCLGCNRIKGSLEVTIDQLRAIIKSMYKSVVELY